MHKRTVYFIAALCLYLGLGASYAQENMAQDNTLMFLNEPPQAVQNPFLPQIPIERKKEPIETEEEETKQEEQQQQPEYMAPIEEPEEEEKVDLGTPTLSITGLIWNSDRPQAIVNGNVLGVGDRMFSVPSDKGKIIPEIKIVNIDKDGLSVTYEDKTVVIKPETETEKE